MASSSASRATSILFSDTGLLSVSARRPMPATDGEHLFPIMDVGSDGMTCPHKGGYESNAMLNPPRLPVGWRPCLTLNLTAIVNTQNH